MSFSTLTVPKIQNVKSIRVQQQKQEQSNKTKESSKRASKQEGENEKDALVKAKPMKEKPAITDFFQGKTPLDRETEITSSSLHSLLSTLKRVFILSYPEQSPEGKKDHEERFQRRETEEFANGYW